MRASQQVRGIWEGFKEEVVVGRMEEEEVFEVRATARTTRQSAYISYERPPGAKPS